MNSFDNSNNESRNVDGHTEYYLVIEPNKKNGHIEFETLTLMGFPSTEWYILFDYPKMPNFHLSLLINEVAFWFEKDK